MKERRKMIGKQLQAIRKRTGYKSAASFAERIGMGVSAYTEYEQGRRMFNYEQAWAMADALQCSLDELGGRDWPPGGGEDPITPEERTIVEDYRRMDEDDRPGFVSTAHALAFAGDAKKEIPERPKVLDERGRETLDGNV